VRLSLLFSLAIGLVALLAVSERIPRWLGNDGSLEAQSHRSVVKQVARSKTLSTKALPIETLPIEIGSRDQRTPPNKEHGRMYKWRDARGGIHIATEPPPKNVQAVIIPFVRERAGKPADKAAGTTKASTKASTGAMPALAPLLSPSALLSVYTPEGFENLLDRVEETARKLHERSSQLESLEKQL